jgi:hypothetical protein
MASKLQTVSQTLNTYANKFEQVKKITDRVNERRRALSEEIITKGKFPVSKTLRNTYAVRVIQKENKIIEILKPGITSAVIAMGTAIKEIRVFKPSPGLMEKVLLIQKALQESAAVLDFWEKLTLAEAEFVADGSLASWTEVATKAQDFINYFDAAVQNSITPAINERVFFLNLQKKVKDLQEAKSERQKMKALSSLLAIFLGSSVAALAGASLGSTPLGNFGSVLGTTFGIIAAVVMMLYNFVALDFVVQNRAFMRSMEQRLGV